MEMDSNPITKPSKKGTILSVAFYVLAAVLLITAFVSLAACHQNITRQLEQGVPVQGNELAKQADVVFRLRKGELQVLERVDDLSAPHQSRRNNASRSERRAR